MEHIIKQRTRKTQELLDNPPPQAPGVSDHDYREQQATLEVLRAILAVEQAEFDLFNSTVELGVRIIQARERIKEAINTDMKREELSDDLRAQLRARRVWEAKLGAVNRKLYEVTMAWKKEKGYYEERRGKQRSTPQGQRRRRSW